MPHLPLTPQQALANFRLLTELHPTRNSPEDYAAAVREVCDAVLTHGILGDDAHPHPATAALADCIRYIEASYPDPDPGTPATTISTTIDDGPEITLNLASARAALSLEH